MPFLIPSRAACPGDDAIFALNAEAGARARTGESILNATIGVLLDEDGKLAVFSAVAEALREVSPEGSAAYAPIIGAPAYLHAVTADLLGERPAVEWATAVATPGGSGAIRLAFGNFLEPGQAALTTSFHWSPYRTLADEAGRRLDTFRMFDAAGRFDAFDFEQKLRAQIDGQGRALVILNSPCHNPTGYSYDDDEWRQIREILARESARAPIALVVDIAYARYAATDFGPTLDRLLELSGRVMLLFCWSASKSFTAYGLRTGALIAVHPDADERRRIGNALGYACRGTWSNCNAGGMAAIAKTLTDPSLRRRVDAERSALKGLLDRRVARWNELASRRGLRYPRYDGGFFTTVFCDDAFDSAERLRKAGVFVVPQTGALRIALCALPERDVARLVDTLAHCVR